jgi:aldose sugar dehydrogenase
MYMALAASLASCAGAEPVVQPDREIGRYSTEEADFRLVQLLADIDHPWALAFLPDGDMLISERSGTLWLFDGQVLVPVSGSPGVAQVGQGGLLDIAIHPDFETNNLVYLSYSDAYDGGYGTVVARAQLSGSSLTGMEEVFRTGKASSGGHHFGSRLAFDNDGRLYVTLGERGSRDRAQDLSDQAGSILRLNDDGSIPGDNPFVGVAGAAPEIFTYGHRNAQGLALNPTSGEIWAHEHGPQGGDEINIIASGSNYGWPIITYGAEYGSGDPIGDGTSAPGMEQPVTYWIPSIAPSGMAFYTGSAFPNWNGDLFVGALAGQHLRRVELDGDRVVSEEVLLRGLVGRVRDVRVGPDGFIYIVTDEDNGGLYRLEPLE